jgi:hypothetical protein
MLQIIKITLKIDVLKIDVQRQTIIDLSSLQSCPIKNTFTQKYLFALFAFQSFIKHIYVYICKHKFRILLNIFHHAVGNFQYKFMTLFK